MDNFLKKVGKGLIALLPIIIVFWLLSYMYDIVEGFFFYIFGITDNNLGATLFIMTFTLLLLYYIGYLVEKNREFLLLKFTELFLKKIPVVKTIYAIVKDVIDIFSSTKEGSYLGVAYVRFGNAKLIGFITKKLPEHNQIALFVPTTPNPTTGLLVYMDEADVEISDMDVSEGFRRIMSLGVK